MWLALISQTVLHLVSWAVKAAPCRVLCQTVLTTAHDGSDRELWHVHLGSTLMFGIEGERMIQRPFSPLHHKGAVGGWGMSSAHHMRAGGKHQMLAGSPMTVDVLGMERNSSSVSRPRAVHVLVNLSRFHLTCHGPRTKKRFVAC